MDYMTPDARAKLDCIERAHTVDDPGRQVVVRQLGDVRVTLDMPAGMAVPRVELLLFSHTPSGGRLAALEALGMSDEDVVNTVNGNYWYTRTDAKQDVEATVWFEASSRRPAS